MVMLSVIFNSPTMIKSLPKRLKKTFYGEKVYKRGKIQWSTKMEGVMIAYCHMSLWGRDPFSYLSGRRRGHQNSNIVVTTSYYLISYWVWPGGRKDNICTYGIDTYKVY